MKKVVLGSLGGFVVGTGVTGLLMVLLMPGMMIVTHESRLGFDQTVAVLQKGIEEDGWSSPATIDLNKSMAKRGVELEPRVNVVQLCKAEYAKNVLTTDRHISALMPCAISVWEADDGTVRVSKMNTGLMAKLFGGNIAQVMGEKVGPEEVAIVKRVVKSPDR